MKDLLFKDDILRTSDTSVFKGRNILSTEIGSLAYAPEFGIDYSIFFGDDFEIQNETFQSYAVSKLAENGLNPLEVLSSEGSLESILNIQLEN